MDIRQHARLAVYAIAALLTLPALALSQPDTQNVEVEPVTCWWRAKVSSVHVGEAFGVVLTCSVLETDAVRAVVDRGRMGSAAVQFPPYEVIGGSQSTDHVTAGRRFMQYEYVVRLIAEDAFGIDVPINGMEISYRIESQVQQDAAVQGREQNYVMPPIPMRVASLVADDARHIREAGVPSLGEIAAREFRARMFRLVAMIFLAVAGLTLAVAVLRWSRRRRTGIVATKVQLLPNRAVLAAVKRELRNVQRDARGGWTPELVARAGAAARVVASYLAGRTVVQRKVDTHVDDGELVIPGMWLSQRRVAVSGATTSEGLRSARAMDGSLAAADLDDALAGLTSARYGRGTELHGAALDEAVATTLRAADRVASRYTHVAEAVASVRQSIRGWRPQAWAR